MQFNLIHERLNLVCGKFAEVYVALRARISGCAYCKCCYFIGESSHQIPVENFELASSNYRGLWIQIENFINPQGEKGENPPLYCLVSLTLITVVSPCANSVSANRFKKFEKEAAHVIEN